LIPVQGLVFDVALAQALQAKKPGDPGVQVGRVRQPWEWTEDLRIRGTVKLRSSPFLPFGPNSSRC
jgi:hypothetical protein